MGFSYAVARRSRSDRDKARELVKQYERDARGAARTSTGWIGIGVVVVVIAFACLFGAAGRDRARPAACAPASRQPVAAASRQPAAATSRRPSAAAPGSRHPAAGRLAAAAVSPTDCRR